MQKKDEHFIDVALTEAEKSLEHGILPVGAVLTFNGFLAGKAHKQETRSYHMDHAETLLCDAFFEGRRFVRGEHTIVLYTTLEPCLMCLGKILHLPISKIVYAASDHYGGSCSLLEYRALLPYRHQRNRIEVVSGVHEEFAKKQLKRFLAITKEPFYLDPKNPLVRYIQS